MEAGASASAGVSPDAGRVPKVSRSYSQQRAFELPPFIALQHTVNSQGCRREESLARACGLVYTAAGFAGGMQGT
jgi:hypothetical protein